MTGNDCCSDSPPPEFPEGTHWLPVIDYDAAVSQLRLQVNGVLSVFDLYGQGVHIRQASTEILNLCENFGLRVRGVDKHLSLEMVRRAALRRGRNGE